MSNVHRTGSRDIVSDIVQSTRKQPGKDGRASIIEWFKRVIGYDAFMVYGDTGSGKTTFAIWLAKQYARHGYKVLYIDTERNLLEHELRDANICYRYIEEPGKVKDFINNLPVRADRAKDVSRPLTGSYDLYILDSLGFPVYYEFSEEWASGKASERGKLLAIAFRIVSRLKMIATFNKSIVLITNQPVSPFAKQARDEFDLAPFGGKSRFGVKEKWVSRVDKRGNGETVIGIYANISRIFPQRKKLFTMIIKTTGYDEYGIPRRQIIVRPYWEEK